MKEKKINISLNLLRLGAILLIINSHSDKLYPSSFKFLASGGAIGNGLFFILSGYFFHLDNDKLASLRKRFFRLFIPAWIMVVISFIVGEFKVSGVIDVIKFFIWPTRFWFVGVAFLYYVIMTFLPKRVDLKHTKVLIILSGILMALDIVVWVLLIPDKTIWIVEDARLLKFIPFKVIYCFIEFCIGYYLRTKKVSGSWLLSAAFAVITFVCFYGFKFLLNKGVVNMEMQIVSHPLTIICVVAIMVTFMKVDLNSKLEGKKIGSFVNYLSGLSLECYVVQFLFIAVMYSSGLVFPVNIIICTISIFIASWVLHITVQLLFNRFHEWKQNENERDHGRGPDPRDP